MKPSKRNWKNNPVENYQICAINEQESTEKMIVYFWLHKNDKKLTKCIDKILTMRYSAKQEKDCQIFNVN